MLTTPVLLVVFNRPDTALALIQAIKKVKPTKLYLAADGPRANKPGEDKLCESTREGVLQAIDWECQVFKLIRENNLGCALAVSGAIDWFFSHEEKGIILEDDCLPNKSFFFFCQELLEFYHDDERIMHISGFNEQDGIQRGDASYYFSNYPSIWGWASWRRAWKFYRLKGTSPRKQLKKEITQTYFHNHSKAANRWFKDFIRCSGSGSAWGYQWPYAIWQQNGLSITPNKPLIRNIGFDERGTHTTSPDKKMMDMELQSLEGPLIHPETFIPHRSADLLSYSKHLYPLFRQRAQMKLRHLARSLTTLF